MSAALKAQILEKHNSLRNKIALGQESRFKSARRMAQMVWNDELAQLAQLNTRQCQMSHDKCRNTAQFKFAGQNLGYMGTSGSHYDPSRVVNSVIDMWYNEHPYAEQSDIDKLSRIYDSSK